MDSPSSSILETIKQKLGLKEEGYDVFDVDVIASINTALMTLCQLGVGPKSGFRINGPEETWIDFTGDNLLTTYDGIIDYVYFYVRLAFDPPTNSFAVNAIKEQMQELVWRINAQAEWRNES